MLAILIVLSVTMSPESCKMWQCKTGPLICFLPSHGRQNWAELPGFCKPEGFYLMTLKQGKVNSPWRYGARSSRCVHLHLLFTLLRFYGAWVQCSFFLLWVRRNGFLWLSTKPASPRQCGLTVNNLFLLSFFRTKIFIRFPKTLFATEDAFEIRKHLLGMVPVPFIT